MSTQVETPQVKTYGWKKYECHGCSVGMAYRPDWKVCTVLIDEHSIEPEQCLFKNADSMTKGMLWELVEVLP